MATARSIAALAAVTLCAVTAAAAQSPTFGVGRAPAAGELNAISLPTFSQPRNSASGKIGPKRPSA